jgi:hypothetical protein
MIESHSMSGQRDEAAATIPDAGADLAVRAWERLSLRMGCCARSSPTAVTRLKRQRREWHKSAVYRLDGAGDGGLAVVGKRCLRSTGRVERDVYEKVMPRLGLPRLRYYGYVEDDDSRFGWLFMGDAGGAKPTMADRGVIATWLARLHAAAAPLSGDVPLPDRGPDYYLGLLPAARQGLGAARTAATRAGRDCRAFNAIAAALARLELHRDCVAATCAEWPRTLVHSDFSRKHVRLRPDEAGLSACVLALDWETAGWGPPAADLADVPWGRSRGDIAADPSDMPEHETPWYGPVSLAVYAETISAFWPGVGRRAVSRLSRVGALFRIIDATCWAARQVELGGVDKGMGALTAYADDLRPAMEAIRA